MQLSTAIKLARQRSHALHSTTPHQAPADRLLLDPLRTHPGRRFLHTGGRPRTPGCGKLHEVRNLPARTLLVRAHLPCATNLTDASLMPDPQSRTLAKMLSNDYENQHALHSAGAIAMEDGVHSSGPTCSYLSKRTKHRISPLANEVPPTSNKDFPTIIPCKWSNICRKPPTLSSPTSVCMLLEVLMLPWPRSGIAICRHGLRSVGTSLGFIKQFVTKAQLHMSSSISNNKRCKVSCSSFCDFCGARLCLVNACFHSHARVSKFTPWSSKHDGTWPKKWSFDFVSARP